MTATSFWQETAVGGPALPVRALDLDQVALAVKLLVDPVRGCSLQAIPSGRREIRQGNDLDGLLAAAEQLFPLGRWLYLSLNPMSVGHTGSVLAEHYLRRRLLMIDADATRPNTSLPATEEEHQRAEDLLTEVDVWLSDTHNWPEPVTINTGNGCCGLWLVDLEHNDASRELCRRILGALAERFKDFAGASIDTGTHLITQNVKLPGSWAQKGPHTEERPHRQVRILSAPQQGLEMVSLELLEELASRCPEKPKKSPTPKDPATFFKKVVTTEREAAYVREALERECAEVAAAPQGERERQLVSSAFSVGQLLHLTIYSRDEATAQLTTAARSCGLDQDPAVKEKGIASRIKRQLAAGEKEPRNVPPEQPSANGTAEKKEEEPTAESATEEKHLKPAVVIYALPDLLALDLPEPRWAVPGLLGEGLTILAGAPKLGKSFLALNLGLTIAAGGMAMGKIKVEPGDVLYLSLEDRLRRVQDRARKVLSGLAIEASHRLHVAVEWPRMDQGGLREIKHWLERSECPKLIVVDVWVKFRKAYNAKGQLYDQDYEAGNAVKQLADKYQCSTTIVHHTRKGKSEDVVEEISGTLGLAGAADGLLVLTRARSDTEGSIFCTGRDIDDRSLTVQFNKQTFCWTLLGDEKETRPLKIKDAILNVFRANGGCLFYPKEMAERVREVDGLGNTTDASVKTTMSRMADAGELEKFNHKYGWPPVQPARSRNDDSATD